MLLARCPSGNCGWYLFAAWGEKYSHGMQDQGVDYSRKWLVMSAVSMSVFLATIG